MASAKDIRDILSLPARGPNDSKAKKAPKKKSNVRASGLTRELYNLMGDNAAPLVAASEPIIKPKFKGRPEEKKSRSRWGGWGKEREVTKWKWEQFENNAREDGLKLSHWVRQKGEKQTEYPFAKYNIQADVYTYTDKEYLNYLRDEEWTKAETDYLFDLVLEYQLRWPVIYDRYDFPSTSSTAETAPSRTMEDIKARYYSVCRKLIRSRQATIPQDEYQSLLASYNFDKSREVARKLYLQSLLSRSASEVKQESQLFLESRRITQNFSRIRGERDQLLALLAGGNGGVGVNMTGRKGKQRDEKKISASDLKHCILRDPSLTHTSAHLRSFRPGPVTDPMKPELSKPLTEILTSLRVPQRLIMPTRGNMDRLEALWVMGKNLVELKRTLIKSENQLKVLKGKGAAQEAANSTSLAPALAPSAQSGSGSPAVVPLEDEKSERGIKRARSGSESEEKDGAVGGRRLRRNVG
ncbi:hypothetical protein BT69DRAFT_1313740 [Atractiella rhizophila]|nr:hypothetical protein BT69DRAFT_1313740 [Atractiella rhizophila]